MAAGTAALDRYIPGTSAVHSADPRVKTGLTVLFIIALTTLPTASWLFIAGFFAVAWATVLTTGISPVKILRRTFIALPFVLVAVPSVFSRSGEPLAEWSTGFITLTPTQEGLEFVATIMLKSWIAVTAAVLLSATTRFMDIVAALRWFRVPELLLAVVAMMYRYLFLLIGEAQRMIVARRARSAAIEGARSGGSIRWRARVTGHMAGSLFVRTFDRSERVYMAMLARGYDGAMFAPGQLSVGRVEIVVAVAFIAALAAAATLARLV